MVQTPPFGQLAPAVFSFLVAAIKGGREVWIVVESLTTCVCRLQQVLGGMRDALAHACPCGVFEGGVRTSQHHDRVHLRRRKPVLPQTQDRLAPGL